MSSTSSLSAMSSERGLLAVCALVVAAAFVIRFVRSAKSPPFQSRSGSGKVEATSTAASHEREPGEWTPISFDYPQVESSTVDISTVKPIPYRPFRWGEYHVTMSIRSMHWNEWIELDQQFFDYHKIVEHRIKTRGDRAIKVNPAQPGIVGSGQAAAEELVHEIAEYLSRRYPAIYHVERKPKSEKTSSGWYGEGEIKKITIAPLQETYDLDEQDSMTIVSLLTQEDYAIMLEGTDGRYYLQAGAICIPGKISPSTGFWRLQDKIGMPLDEIHLTGNVPHYQSKLHLSMSRFFKRLPVDKPVVRNNYGFQVVKPAEPSTASDDPLVALDPTELAWSRTMHGNEDKLDFERSAVIRGTQSPTNQIAQAPAAPLDPATVYMRTERQTLRRLPKTGGIVFTIRVYQTPVVELAKEPGVPGRLASSIRGWSEEVAQYKDLFAYKDILDYLDQRHADQVAQGIIQPDELRPASVYPF